MNKQQCTCGRIHWSAVAITITCQCGASVRFGGSSSASSVHATQTDLPITNKPKRDTTSVISWLKFFRAPEDRGLGDTVERLLAKTGARKVKAWLQSAGLDCGCAGRQAKLNRAFPY